MDDTQREAIKAIDFICKKKGHVPPNIVYFHIVCVIGKQIKKRRRGCYPMNLFYTKKICFWTASLKSAFGQYLQNLLLDSIFEGGKAPQSVTISKVELCSHWQHFGQQQLTRSEVANFYLVKRSHDDLSGVNQILEEVCRQRMFTY